ncbi:peroxiredoxin family protein [Haloferula sp.]|uniref:peroxiredoxin family protein n=1 Tax=Haloferula sp. TaxID=2497595 RepID=UPI003C756295
MPRFLLILLTSLASAEPPLPGHSHQGHAFNEGPRQEAVWIDGTGDVHLPITSDWDSAQTFFNQGLGQLHGFWYFEAERSFRQIAANDPECAMAYWGMAMANWENQERAKGFIDKASELFEYASPQEQAYINAQANFLDGIPKDPKARNQELLRDLEDLIHRYPNDLEAKAFLACRLWQFSEKGGIPIPSHEAVDALLQQIFAKAPLHPAHHYRIHLWDKQKAGRAIDSAAVLATTAPAIAHMWHMPSHIYWKLHRYEDTAWHQVASARIDHAHMIEKRLLPDQIHNYAHNNEWLARTWVHLGNKRDALAMAKSLLANPRHPKLNSLEGKAHSYRYGRDRLIEILEKFELWDEVILLAGTPWLEPLPKTRDELPRLRLLGLAQYHLDQTSYLEKTIEKVEKLKAKTEQAHQKAQAQARKGAGDKPRKELDRLARNAGRPHAQELETINKTLDELTSCLAFLNDDPEAALSVLEKSQAPSYAKALDCLVIGEIERADSLSKKAVESGPGETLPLAARIEVLHQLGRHDEAREVFETLRKSSSQLDLAAPTFARLAPIAAEYAFPEDWTLPYETPADFGERPDDSTLGPLHWKPPAAPRFNIYDQFSTRFSPSNIFGWKKPVILIHYLGHSCLHCAEQLNAMAEQIDEFEAAGLAVVAVSTDQPEDLEKSQANYNAGGEEFPFQLLADPDLDTFRAYGAYDEFEKQALHGTFLISPDRKLLWSDIGAEPFMDLDFLLEESKRLLKLHRR